MSLMGDPDKKLACHQSLVCSLGCEHLYDLELEEVTQLTRCDPESLRPPHAVRVSGRWRWGLNQDDGAFWLAEWLSTC